MTSFGETGHNIKTFASQGRSKHPLLSCNARCKCSMETCMIFGK